MAEEPEIIASETTLQAAAEAYAQAEALFASIGDGAIATDEFGRITRVNKVALELLGFSETEMLGEWFPSVLMSYSEDGRPISLIDRPITRAFLTGMPVSARSFYKMKDGGLLPISLTVSPLMLAGKPIGAIELFRDITEEYELDRMKSDFISLASHQLRTPLSAIKTYSHMLLDGFMGPISPAQRKSLRTIVAASNRMNELISMLLNVSRVESGNVVVTPKSVNLNHLTDDVFKDLAVMAADRGVELVARLPKQAISVKTDGLIAKEVLINLVSNAIKYTINGGQVSVQLRSRTNAAVFAVSDKGVGIPQNAQEHIFAKFYRAPNVVRQETTGTGLGLYLAKGLVDALGGKVWFESKEGEGSTFYFLLPKSYQVKKEAEL